MVAADSHGTTRTPPYSGTRPMETITFRLQDSHPLRLAFPHHSTTQQLYHSTPPQSEKGQTHPTTPATQRLTALTRHRFSLLRFRSPLLTEYLLLRVLRCFTSPRSPHHPIHSDDGNQTQLWPGFPIRTPSDHSSFANSPRPIAGYNVLLRLPTPRHPPSALKN